MKLIMERWGKILTLLGRINDVKKKKKKKTPDDNFDAPFK